MHRWGAVNVSLFAATVVCLAFMPMVEGWSVWGTLWWFVVTATTVGYGDMAPVTHAGKALGMPIIILAVGGTASTMGQMTVFISKMSSRRKRGLLPVSMKNHVVVLGYTEGVTESIVSELLGAAKSPSSVVVVDDAADESPVPGVAFIKGELDEDSTLEKACCADAKSVIIYGKSDDQAVFSALAVAHLAESAGTSPHVVAYLRNPAKARHITHIGGRVTMVPKISCQMVVQEALDPGVSGVLSSVTSHTKGTQAVFGVKVPAFFKGRTFGELLPAVKDRCGMLLVGVSGQAGMDVNPAADTMIRPGDTVYVFGGARTQAKTVPWADL